MDNLSQNHSESLDFVFGPDGHAGLSQGKAAELLRTNQSTISRLLSGYALFTSDELENVKQQGFRGHALVKLARYLSEARRVGQETKHHCLELLEKAAIIGVQAFIDRLAGIVEQPQSQQPTLPPAPTIEERLNIVERGMSILSRLGALDDRTKLAYADQVRNITLSDQLAQTPSAGAEPIREWTISDRVVALGYKAQKNGVLQGIGTIAANLYRKKHAGQEPPTRGQYVDGAYRTVRAYTTVDLDIVDQAIRTKLGEPPSKVLRLPPNVG